MKHKQFDKLMDKHWAEIQKLCGTKGMDYSDDDDRLSHFKEQAEMWGITPLQLWGVLAGKHWSAIANYAKRGQVESEPIESRVHDLILYAFLLLALAEDTNIDQTTPFDVVR